VGSAALVLLVQQANAGQIAIVADVDTGIAQYDDAPIGPNTGLDQ